ncbi:MAG: 4Fe-4S binding protein [Candidatus Competibacteraceae bacterium]|nr:4Fe-4S binding protein [Candidatus Competibacteraceae bacterium]
MNQRWLKTIRVVVSLAFLALTTLLFVDFDRFGETPATTMAIYPQVVPSLLNFTETLAWATTGFLLVLGITLLFGRVYCSMICPLGALQDLFIRIADKLRKPRRVKFRYQKPRPALHYGILALTIALFLSGNVLALSLLDPFSNFGRIASDLLRPLYVAAHNGFGQLLESFGVYGPFPLHWKAPALMTLIFPILFLIGLAWLSAFKGRLFCNTLCPVGALLGLISRFAVFKIQIPKTACTLCAHCSIHCKAGCIHLKTQEVDFSRCVACFNCIPVCDAHGIGYARTRALGTTCEETPNLARRALLRGATVTIAGLTGLSGSSSGEAKPHNQVPSTVVNARTCPIAPPGAGDIARFNDLCTACHLCVSACPYGVLQPALLDYGLSGLLQPHLDFTTGYCSYECNRCGDICPTGAIQPLTLPNKKTVQLGIAHFIRDNCIVYTDHTACGACDEYCPTNAIEMVPYRNGLTIPEVRKSVCIGCGACENACPVRPHRAIYVEGHPVHQQAEPPQVKPLEHQIKSGFPF